MSKHPIGKHRRNCANIITFFRFVGTILLLTMKPLSPSFFLLYTATGLTDVLDGWIARKTKTASDFGARLDSIADLLFYTVVLFLMFPSLWNTLPVNIWYTVAAIAMIRISAYLIAAAKYRRFTALHTKLNKLTGMGAFLIPYLLATEYVVGFCWVVCAVAVIASLEELFIHLRSQICCSNTEKTMKTNQ